MFQHIAIILTVVIGGPLATLFLYIFVRIISSGYYKSKLEFEEKVRRYWIGSGHHWGPERREKLRDPIDKENNKQISNQEVN